jgi:uncharacterized protein (DUF1501 family)
VTKVLDADIPTAEAAALLHTAEDLDRATMDRRRFLQLIGMGVGAGALSGGAGGAIETFLLGCHRPVWAAPPTGAGDGILLVITMFGGNDGLNTVVPISDGNYYQQHGSLAIGADQTLRLDDRTGLNPALTSIKGFWDRGQLAIVEGVGYANPDLSHFTSMAYWMSAQPGVAASTGWIGRWLDEYLAGSRDLYAAAELGSAVPLLARGVSQTATCVPPERPNFGASYDPVEQRLYQSMRALHTNAYGPWHAAVAGAYADFLDVAASVAPSIPATMPSSEIVAKAEAAARLINANLGFRVFTASWGDFDSHAGQPNMHPHRMAELNQAITRFFELLDPAWASRVTVMTMSEFGRTSWGNAGNGTDHGSAAPHFVLGQNVKGGYYGQRPSLSGLGRWDRLPHHVDFRSYFTSVIDGWLGGGGSSVLGGSYEDLGLFTRPPGMNADGTMSPGAAKISSPSALVPIPPVRFVDTRDGTGGVAVRALSAGERLRVPIAGANGLPGAGVTAVVANVTVVDASQPNFFTVYPGSTIRPFTSNVNAGPGRPVPNLVIMGVGDDGCVEVYNSHGTAHCVVDVFGYFIEGGGDRFTAVSPDRLFDTRLGLGVRPGKVPAATPIEIQVAGRGGIPAEGVSAVVMNLTITEPESPGWMRLTPSGQTAATTSNVNFGAGDTVPNLVVCKIGAGGRVTLDGVGVGTHVLGDVFGYFGPAGGELRTLPPKRLLDTREGNGAPIARVGATSIRLPVAGRAQVPANATAVVLNVTATNVAGPTFVTVWPDAEPQPGTSNLNAVGGQTIANLVVCRVGSGGALRLASPVAPCDLVADVLGYFVG